MLAVVQPSKYVEAIHIDDEQCLSYLGNCMSLAGRHCELYPHGLQVSQVYWVYLLVSLLPKADCHLTIRVAESSDKERGGTKVKVR